MNNFEKLNFIFDTLGYEYFGWNNPKRAIMHFKSGYWAPINKMPIYKINVYKNPGNYPDWELLIKLANLTKSNLGQGPYCKDIILDRIFNQASDKVNNAM